MRLGPALASLFLFSLPLACGDDTGTTGSDSSSSGGSGSSTGSGSTTAPDPTNATEEGSATGSSSTTAGSADSADTGSTTAVDPSSSSDTTEGLDPMGLTFFVTSVGSGPAGGDLGGLEGADASCQMLAEAVGEGARTWQAYLSTSDVDARDRIGDGPWYNAAGEMIAADVEALHTDGLSNDDPQHMLDENGELVPANEHDILTGSEEDGTLLEDSTFNDWTSSGEGDQARVGHSDIPMNPMFSPSWNSAHDTIDCTPANIELTGGAGRLYCFAID